MLKKYSWILLLILFFSLVFIQSMTFVYVDGDDAASMAYHLLGRDAALQRPYVLYQGMADLALSLLPPNEHLLRVTALLFSNLATICFVALLLHLLFSWIHPPLQAPKWLITLFLLLAVPEISYLGLIYSPTLIAMTFLLLAHLLARKSYRDRWLFGKWKLDALLLYLLSFLLFGLGVSFRWNTLLYGGIIFVDLVLLRQKYREFRLKHFFHNSFWLWGSLALLSSFGMIMLSGYRTKDFVEEFQTVRYVLNQTGTLTPGVEVSSVESLLRIILALTPEFTPIFLLLVSLGLIFLFRRKNLLWMVVLVGILGVLPWMRSGNPKFIITSLPVLGLCFVIGFSELWQWLDSKKWRGAGKTAFWVLLLLPWFLGVCITRPDTAWGPEFSLKPYDYQDIGDTSVDITLGSGMAFPTPEGPRSLWGHAYVLWGGEWREMVTHNADERKEALRLAKSEQIPLVVTNWSPDFFLTQLYAEGYQTTDPLWKPREGDIFAERIFFDDTGKTVQIFSKGFEAEALDELLLGLKEQITNSEQIILTGYPSTMRALYLYAPDALTLIGERSTQIDLAMLLADY